MSAAVSSCLRLHVSPVCLISAAISSCLSLHVASVRSYASSTCLWLCSHVSPICLISAVSLL